MYLRPFSTRFGHDRHRPIVDIGSAATVAPMDIHPDVARLANLLHKLEQHLATNGAEQWATSISRCRASVEKSDAWGLHAFLGMFGGMGSLNDLVLQRDNEMLTAENESLQVLLSDAWSLATRLQREETETRSN